MVNTRKMESRIEGCDSRLNLVEQHIEQLGEDVNLMKNDFATLKTLLTDLMAEFKGKNKGEDSGGRGESLFNKGGDDSGRTNKGGDDSARTKDNHDEIEEPQNSEIEIEESENVNGEAVIKSNSELDLGRKNVDQEEFEDDDSDGPEEVSDEIEVEESENVNGEAVIKS